MITSHDRVDSEGSDQGEEDKGDDDSGEEERENQFKRGSRKTKK